MMPKVILAARSIKDYEQLLVHPCPVIILMNVHLSQLQSLVTLAHKHAKQLWLHADLVQGLKHDEAAAQFLCQNIRPDGLISTHAQTVLIARKHNVTAIQRIFLIDSHSLETSYRILANSQPDYIEVLPGIVPHLLEEVRQRTGRPVLAGGFIRSQAEVVTALEHGALAVTTSNKKLWLDPSSTPH
ncbi:glycerol-3-phosphate responsive antiterminator [Alicyclobacillus tolerans]|nr:MULTISPECIES: glycerol-3-phosphate responsive antiterminator [Alicyclobacillus]SHK09155.1 glycerol uptake operon antiterminator [Alicyclobacillus montanus]